MTIIYGIILAGGKSSRMKQNKMLLQYDGQPIIYHTVKSMKSVCDRIIIITGHYEVDYLKILLEFEEITIVHNKDYQKGMFSSVQKGVEGINGSCFIIPGDYPLIYEDTYIEALRQQGEIRVPTYKGRKGHPIFLEKEIVQKLQLEDKDSNLKAFRNKYQVTYFDVDNKGILLDIDNINDYQQLITRERIDFVED